MWYLIPFFLISCPRYEQNFYLTLRRKIGFQYPRTFPQLRVIGFLNVKSLIHPIVFIINIFYFYWLKKKKKVTIMIKRKLQSLEKSNALIINVKEHRTIWKRQGWTGFISSPALILQSWHDNAMSPQRNTLNLMAMLCASVELAGIWL